MGAGIAALRGERLGSAPSTSGKSGDYSQGGVGLSGGKLPGGDIMGQGGVWQPQPCPVLDESLRGLGMGADQASHLVGGGR